MAGTQPVIYPSRSLYGGVCAAAPAKINRFLHILGRQNDGYHRLETGFQFTQWCDWIHFRVSEAPGIRILNDPMDLGEENLVYQAATRVIDPKVHGIDILIEKNLPAGSGLGGGSSDAATTLVSLNALFGLGHSRDKLQELGFTIGADVPVFVLGESCLASGFGEKLETYIWPGTRVLIADPQIHVSTGEVFQHPKLTRDTPSCKIRALQLDATTNDCESLVREIYPEVEELINRMQVFGDPRLTGTGGCVFVVDPINTESVDAALRDIAKAKVCLLSNDSMLYTCRA
tara:strand:+ start:3894 stop:4757 length:864 start_codon:yes stop_codon:yes gene_type:complete